MHYKLCWLREPFPGELHADLGTSVSDAGLELALMTLLPPQRTFAGDASLSIEQVSIAVGSWDRFASSPIWFQRLLTVFFGRIRDARDFEVLRERVQLMERIADRIRELSRTHNQNTHGAIEVHLPQLTRQEWPNRFEVLAGTLFQFTEQRLHPVNSDPAAFEESALRIAASIHSGTPNEARLSFLGACAVARPFAHNLNKHYGVPASPAADLRDVRVGAVNEAPDSWRRLASSNGAMFTRGMNRFAFALQSMLHAWVPAFALADEEAWSDADLVLDMAVYSATPPFADAPNYLGYDVLDSDHNALLRERLRRRMPAAWQRLRESLTVCTSGESARELAPRHSASRLALLVERSLHQKRLRSLLVAEGLIASAVATFVKSVARASTPRRLPALIRELDQVFRTQLQRMVPGNSQAQTALRMLVLLEAANAFHCALGGEHSLSVRFEDTNGGVYSNHDLPAAVSERLPRAA